jgi:hypothetical protein
MGFAAPGPVAGPGGDHMKATAPARGPRRQEFLSMSLATAPDPMRAPRSLWRRLARASLVGVGGLMVVVGVVGTVLPGHLGLPVLIVGLIVVLRSSREARRQFIGLQRRHPRVLFPIRRLLRREPEVLAVAWQQALRLERLLLPRKWRPARNVRRRVFKRPRRPRT